MKLSKQTVEQTAKKIVGSLHDACSSEYDNLPSISQKLVEYHLYKLNLRFQPGDESQSILTQPLTD